MPHRILRRNSHRHAAPPLRHDRGDRPAAKLRATIDRGQPRQGGKCVNLVRVGEATGRQMRNILRSPQQKSELRCALAGPFSRAAAAGSIAAIAGVAIAHPLQADLDACRALRNVETRAACFEAVATQALSALNSGAVAQSAGSPSIAPLQANIPLMAFVRKAQELLVQDFKDPASAQWRGLAVSTDGTYGTRRVLCGQVNAKNAYGGYIGFKEFAVAESDDGSYSWATSDSPTRLDALSYHCKFAKVLP